MAVVQSFDEFYAINRKQDEPDHSFLRGRLNVSDRNIKLQDAQYHAEVAAKYDEREWLRAEYELQVAAGLIIAPSKIERLLKAASGHPDNPATQAARRLLEKYGVDYGK